MFKRSSLVILQLSMVLMGASASQAQSFPDFHDAVSFRSDQRTLALVGNLPNINARDAYIGLKTSANLLPAASGDLHLVNDVRVSVYPNPGYDLWLQLSSWSNSSPSFMVATGVQYEYPGTDTRLRKVIGLGWSESYGAIQVVRDVRIFGVLGYSSKNWEYGVSAAMIMQHGVIENGWGIPDYDETFYTLVPYIGMMIAKAHTFQVMLPLASSDLALSLAYEFQFGRRQ